MERSKYKRAYQHMSLALETLMARPKSDQPRKVHYRRMVLWSPEMTALAEHCVALSKTYRIYMPRNLYRNEGINYSGVV